MKRSVRSSARCAAALAACSWLVLTGMGQAQCFVYQTGLPDPITGATYNGVQDAHVKGYSDSGGTSLNYGGTNLGGAYQFFTGMWGEGTNDPTDVIIQFNISTLQSYLAAHPGSHVTRARLVLTYAGVMNSADVNQVTPIDAFVSTFPTNWIQGRGQGRDGQAALTGEVTWANLHHGTDDGWSGGGWKNADGNDIGDYLDSQDVLHELNDPPGTNDTWNNAAVGLVRRYAWDVTGAFIPGSATIDVTLMGRDQLANGYSMGNPRGEEILGNQGQLAFYSREFTADLSRSPKLEFELDNVPCGESIPPAITNVSPVNNAPFILTNTPISFVVADAGDGVDRNTIALWVNGVDVSASLNITGNAAQYTVQYILAGGLPRNEMIYLRIQARDRAGQKNLGTANSQFDTFDPDTVLVIESEDYNFDGGQFRSRAEMTYPTGEYQNLSGVAGTDYADTDGGGGKAYREMTDVGPGTETTGDILRLPGSIDPEYDYTFDFDVGWTAAGEWLNYTRETEPGAYRVFLRVASPGSGNVVQLGKIDDATVADPGQGYDPQSSFPVPNTGAWQTYTNVELIDPVFRDPVTVSLGAPTSSLRLLCLTGGVNLQYLVLVPTAGHGGGPVPISANPAPDAAGVAPNVTISATLNGRDTGLDLDSVRMTLNGQDVSAALDVTGNASLATVSYQPPQLLELDTRYTVGLSYQDSTAAQAAGEWSFTTMATAGVLTAAGRTGPLGSASEPGFNVRCVKADPNGAGFRQMTTLAAAEDLLAGAIPATIDVTEPRSVINMLSSGDGIHFGGDDAFPGLTIGTDDDDFAMEATGCVELAAGFYHFGVNSDDGFTLSIGGQVIVEYPDIRAPADTFAGLIVEEDGTYPLRCLFYERAGGGEIEVFLRKSDGSLVLLNDVADPESPRAFRTCPEAPELPPTIVAIRREGDSVVIDWTDGTPPFQVQTAPTAAGPWADLGTPTNGTTATIPVGADGSKAIRVLGQ